MAGHARRLALGAPCWTLARAENGRDVRIERRLETDPLDAEGGRSWDVWLLEIAGDIDERALAKAADAAREFINEGSDDPALLPAPREFGKNFYGDAVRFDVEASERGFSTVVYGFIDCTAAELGMRGAAACFDTGAIYPRFGEGGEDSSPQGFRVKADSAVGGDAVVTRRLIGPDAWRIEIEGAVSWRVAQRACGPAAYHANPNAMGPQLPPNPYVEPIRQCACGISSRSWICPQCKADEYYP